MPDMKAEALRYLDRGWSVIPAQTRGKKPLVKWEEFTNRRPTPEEVNRWWTRWPKANIALVTGRVSGIVVVDVDVDRGGSPKRIFKSDPTGTISRTGSGGFHLFYSYPDNSEQVYNRVGADGIDIRGDGGYVIAPPSLHANGKQYEFVRYDKLMHTPKWVLEEPADVETHASNSHWLSDLLRGGKRGGRNDACTRLAGYFVSKDMAKDVTLQLIQDWNTKNNPPLNKSEIQTIVDSVYRTEFRRNRGKKKKAEDAPSSLSVMDFDSYMSKFGDAAIRWNIEDWMPESTIAFVISPPGTYKTWTVFDLAVSVASGKPFLGQYEVRDPGPVLILQQEDFHGQIVERIANIVAHREALDFSGGKEDDVFECPNAPKLPIYFHPDRALRFDDDDLMRSLEDLVSRIKPKLVIIDPLYSAGSVDDYMAKTAEQMFPLKRMRDQYGCSFLIVHHTKKKSEGADREGGWGSQFLNAFMETGWQIRRTDDNNAVTVNRHFKVKGEVPPLYVTFDINTESQPYRYEITCENAEEVLSEQHETKKTDAAIKKAEGDIFSYIRKKPLSVTEIADKLGVHRSTASRRLTQLTKAGALEKTQDNKYKIAQNLPEF